MYAKLIKLKYFIHIKFSNNLIVRVFPINYLFYKYSINVFFVYNKTIFHISSNIVMKITHMNIQWHSSGL